MNGKMNEQNPVIQNPQSSAMQQNGGCRMILITMQVSRGVNEPSVEQIMTVIVSL